MSNNVLRFIRVAFVVVALATTAAIGLELLMVGTLDSSARSPGSPRAPTALPATPTWTDGGAVVLVGAGDIADCETFEDELTADLVETIPGVVFTLGDNANSDGSVEDFEACYGPSWGRTSIKDRTRPAVGDNEYRTAGAEGYFSYFGEATDDGSGGYYAYDAGEWRVYVLNSNCGEIRGCSSGSTQGQWLRNDLAANPRRCVLAVWHHPLFSSGPHAPTRSTADLWQILEEAGAELILNGNDHHYERFDPQTFEGVADPEGILAIIAGTGGSRPVGFQSPIDNSVVRKSHVFGVLRIELAPRSYAFEFITVAGPEFSDRGTGTCH